MVNLCCCFAPKGDNDTNNNTTNNNNDNNDNNNSSNDTNPNLPLGVSVYHLKYELLPEVKATRGLDLATAKIYDLEPHLKSKTNLGLIRKKGEHVICPRDRQIGAAYVDAIEQRKDFVGRANIMLSYAWGYATCEKR